MTCAVDVPAFKAATQGGREGSHSFYSDRVGQVPSVQDERVPGDTGLEGTDTGDARSEGGRKEKRKN